MIIQATRSKLTLNHVPVAFANLASVVVDGRDLAHSSRGIVPDGCLSLAPDSLLWEGDTSLPPLTIDDLPKELELGRSQTRDEAAAQAEKNRVIVQKWLMEEEDEETDRAWQIACGVVFRAGLDGPDQYTVLNWPAEGSTRSPRRWPSVEVHSVRTTRRMGPDGQDVRQLVIEVAQRRRGFFDPERQRAEDEHQQDSPASPDFIFRGGTTLIFDLFSGKLRYTIRKRIADNKRLMAQRSFLAERASGTFGMAYPGDSEAVREPFAMIHRRGF